MKNVIYSVACLLILTSCGKKVDQDRINPYDKEYQESRNYTLTYSHTVVDDADGNGNGIWEPDENVILAIYFTHNGVDPALIEEVDIGTQVSGNGFIWWSGLFSGNSNYTYMDYGETHQGIRFGRSNTEGYEVNWMEPGTTDYILVGVKAFSTLNTTIPFEITFEDWDGQVRTILWDYPTY